MGLRTWQNDNIRKTDVALSKNDLAEGEIRELNRLTTILLDIFEDQLDSGRLVVMQDAQALLDRQRKLKRHRESDERIAALAKEAKDLPKPPRRSLAPLTAAPAAA